MAVILLETCATDHRCCEAFIQLSCDINCEAQSCVTPLSAWISVSCCDAMVLMVSTLWNGPKIAVVDKAAVLVTAEAAVVVVEVIVLDAVIVAVITVVVFKPLTSKMP